MVGKSRLLTAQGLFLSQEQAAREGWAVVF